MTLPSELSDIRDEVRGYAEAYGLDFFETIFEMVDWKQMNMVAAYDGFPARYPHWRFGMAYKRLSQSYAYGLSKIYELVINNDPAYGYLLSSNPTVDQKLVMAHVYGHVDFFKNNYFFSHTDRKAVDHMANHATRVRRHIERIGLSTVEAFLDICLSLENLIDYYSPHIKRHRAPETRSAGEEPDQEQEPRARRLKAGRSYMEHYINPKQLLAEEQQQLDAAQRNQEERFPEEPERDVLAFLIAHAPLQEWQRDVMDIVREEAYYFAPQGMTKVMNEGWASFWHTRIMTQKAMRDDELIDYADRHSGTVYQPRGQLNPYKLGLELLRDIEERWNRGRFGKEYAECDDMARKARWDTGAGLGLEKVFQVRRIYNDVTFIDEFLTPEFAAEHKMFSFDYDKKSGNYYIASREFDKIKQQLLFQLTNFGQPRIAVVDANFANRGELQLEHTHEGQDLRPDYAAEVLKNLQTVWNRPVHLVTAEEGTPVRISFDGDKVEKSVIKAEV